MTELDERLAEALHKAVPQPPHDLDPAAIRTRSLQQRGPLRRRFGPALAAAAVIAVAVGVGISRSENPTGPASGGSPRQLVAVRWRVDTIDGERPGQYLALRIEPNGRFWQSVGTCTGLEGKLTIARTVLTVRTVRPMYGNCAVPVGQAQQHFMRTLQSVFAGRIAWSVNGTQLTLRKEGAPTVVYIRAASPTPATTGSPSP
jgi:hypothetical protein